MPGEPWVQWCAPKCLTTGSWTSLGVLWLRLCLLIRVGRFDPWLGDPWKTWFSELLDLGIVAFADFCGVNILSMADGKLPKWRLWTLELESSVHNVLPGSGVNQFQHTTTWVTMWVWLSWSHHSGETTGRDIYMLGEPQLFGSSHPRCWWFSGKESTWKCKRRSLGEEVPLEEGTATHSSFLAWRIPWTEAWWATGVEKRVGHDLATEEQWQSRC